MTELVVPAIFIFKNCFDSLCDSANSLIISKLDKIKRVVSLNVSALNEKEINLIIVGSDTIKDLNREFRQIDQPTDVLSFPINGSVWGEIWVSPHEVSEQSESLGESFDVELLRVVVHGLLHLAGFDHKSNYSEESSEEMFLLQEKILADILN